MSYETSLTNEQKDAVNELKRRTINDCTPGMIKDDTTFHRFCKARDYKLEPAELMLRKHIAWRKQYQVDTILTDYTPPEVLVKYLSICHIGFDKEGCPIQYSDIGGLDTEGIFDSVKKSELVKYAIYIAEKDWERCRLQTEKLGRLITKAVYICNNDLMSLSQISSRRVIEMCFHSINIYQDNYPERIKVIFHINAAKYFRMLFNLVKSVVAAAVLQKIHIYGREEWKAVLRNTIDADQLPAFLGGTKTDHDGDPLCKSFVIHGHKVPIEYYRKKTERTLHLHPDVDKILVRNFRKSEREFEVSKVNSILEWEFESAPNDIGFGLNFKSDSVIQERKLEELIPVEKVDTSYGLEVGSYKCDKPGTYIIIFDNTHSWISSREVYFRTRIVDFDQES